MNTNFFVAEDEAFNPNKVLTRKEMDAFIGDRGIKSYAGVLKKDNKLFYNFIRVKVAELYPQNIYGLLRGHRYQRNGHSRSQI